MGDWLNEYSHSNKLAGQAEMETRADEVTRKKMKRILENYLVSRGWKPDIAWGMRHGIDIEAKRGKDRWIIQVKGSTILPTLIVNGFVSVLGEVLQRMDDPICKYSIALPDIGQFRRLWERLPALAKTRTGITALFIKLDGDRVEEV